jgi:drug/metabolite transporter (DMT)-like permease
MDSVFSLTDLGKLLALSSALIWAFAVILFRITGKEVQPLGLNLFKSLLVIPLVLISILITQGPIFPDSPWQTYAVLLLSGVVGIGISDTLFFASLNRIGASLLAIVNCSYSPFVIILASIFLTENMGIVQLLGVFLIITAVLLISQRKQKSPIPRQTLLSGIGFGLAAMTAMAVSIILMKPLLDTTSILWATLLRTTGGMLFLGVVMIWHPQRKVIWGQISRTRSWKPMIPGSFLGGYLALIVWMGGMKLIQASEASALNQMSTVFIFVLGVIFLKERATKEKIIALLLAVIGVFLVTLF